MGHDLRMMLSIEFENYKKSDSLENLKNVIHIFYNINQYNNSEEENKKIQGEIINSISENIKKKDYIELIKEIYLNKSFETTVLKNKDRFLNEAFLQLIKKIRPLRLSYMLKKTSNSLEKQAFYNLISDFILKNEMKTYAKKFWDRNIKNISFFDINNEDVFEKVIDYIVKK